MYIYMMFIPFRGLPGKGRKRYICWHNKSEKNVMNSLQKQTIRGVFFTILGTALFTPVYAAGKLADGAIPALLIMMMRYLGGFLTVSTVIAVSRTKLSTLKSSKPHLHALRACLGIGGGACTIHAAASMPIADATAIGLTEGLMAVALAALILHERVTLGHWLFGCLCALGAYVVISDSVSLNTLGYAATEGAIAALAGALFIAFESLTIKVLARRENALGVLVYVNGFATLILLGPALYLANSRGITWQMLAPFILLGPIAITAQFCNIKGYRYLDISVIGPLNYTWILFATALGVFVFDEIPDINTALGAALIVIGGIGLIRVSSHPAPVISDGKRP